ncbi:MAG: hypothetical protein HKL86_01125 [Acidimicrobiaceae bacterium]|nr:hypothetical protein [Acidimicrobiaceae bacterium]
MTTGLNRTREIVRILRFDRVQIVTHWLNAAFFAVLVATAIPLYFGSFFGIVLERHVVQLVHLWTGLAWPLPIIVSMLGPWGTRMRRDLRRVSFWTRGEIEWIKSFGQSPLKADKFNPGQKLNTLFVASTLPVLLVSGSMLQWFRFFSVPLRVGATFVHDTFALGLVVVVVGHIMMALTHREMLQSMFTGTVSETWAKTYAADWFEECSSALDDADETQEI